MGLDKSKDIDLYGIPLDNGCSVKVTQDKKEFIYIFFDKDEDEFERITHTKSPIEQNEKTTVGKTLNSICKDTNEFKNTLQSLNNYLLEYEKAKEELHRIKKEREIAETRDRIDSAMKWYSTLENPLLWLASEIDWVTAGERTNIMISFLTFCSQVILKQPISVVGEGLGSSGKNHVIETALSFIPERFVKYEKKPTLPSMFHRSKDNPYYYNGVIVYYGDMGGLNDQDEAMETKNILKELQSEGYVNRPITVRESDEFTVKDLELIGHSCLAYTTAQDFELDSQEASRSIEFKPRTDNKEIYDMFMNFIGLEGEVYEEHKEAEKTLTERLPYVILGLREWVTGIPFHKEVDDKTKDDNVIRVINPFPRVITRYIGDSQYFKRDRPKYNNILKVITVFNCYHRELKGDTLYCTLDDIQLFLTLFAEYRASIEHNLRPAEIEILREIDADLNKFNDNLYKFLNLKDMANEDEDGSTLFVTSVPTYVKYSELGYTKQTVYRAFNAFEEKGIFAVAELENYSRTKYYTFESEDAFSNESDIIAKDYELEIIDKDIKLWELNYPKETVHFLMQDKATEGMDIQKQHYDVKIPYWRRADEKYFKGDE